MPTVPFENASWVYIPPDTPPVATPPLPPVAYIAPTYPPADWSFEVGPGASAPDSRPLRVLTSATHRRLTVRVDEHATATFTIDGRDEEAADITPLVTDLWVRRNGLLVFRGRITAANHTVTESQHSVAFTAVDYRGMLGYRTVGDAPVSFTAEDQADIAWELIDATQNSTGGDWGITPGVIPAGTPRDAMFPAGKSIRSAIDEIARLQGGFEWEIDPELQLNIWTPRRGSDTGVVLDFAGGAVSEVKQSLEPARFGNAVIVTGSGTGTVVPVLDETDDLPTDPRGRWELVESFPSVEEQTRLDERAPQTLAAASQFSAPFTVTLRPLRWDGRSHLWVGDIAGLRVGSGALTSERVRVAEISVTPGDDGTETVRLGLVPEPDSEEGS